MADEITVSIYGAVTNGELDRVFQPDSISVTQAGVGSYWTTQNVGFAASEAITPTDITTLGWCFCKNLGPTNYVSIGPYDTATLYKFIRLEAGEIAAFRLEPGVVIHAQANTAAVDLDILILED